MRTRTMITTVLVAASLLACGSATAQVRTPAAAVPASAVDPGVPGPHPTVTGEYDVAPIQLPDVFEPVEMQGVVVAPQGTTGARPLVLLLHGFHEVCFDPATRTRSRVWPCPDGYQPLPSYRGYLQTQRLLASWGYVTVSISANGINGQERETTDNGAQARSSLIRQHLRHWADWTGSGSGSAQAPEIVRQAPAVDLSRVLLVGHSRGGEGVNRAAMDSLNPPPAEVDTAAGAARWQVRGTVMIAPTAFGQNPVADVPSMVILPSCDGDSANLVGQQYVDATRGVSHGTALHSALYLVGANHNYFNTEWTPGQAVAEAEDDFLSATPHPDCTPGTAPGRLTAAEQQAAGATFIAAAARVFVDGDDRVRPLLDGSGVRAASAGRARVLSHALGAARIPLLLPEAVDTGSGARICRLVDPDPDSARSCGLAGSSPHAVSFSGQGSEPGRTAIALDWESPLDPGQAVQLRPARPVALGEAQSVAMRMIVPAASTGTRLEVAVTDAAGRRAGLGEVTLSGLPGTSTASGWAQEVRLPLAPARRAGIDLNRVTGLELVPRSTSGRAWLLDAWGWRAGLPNPRTGPLTRIDLGASSEAEGDDGVRTLEVPVSVTGEEPAQIRLLVAAPDGSTTHQLVTVRPGDQKIRLEVEVAGNTRYGEAARYAVWARAVQGAVIGRYLGEVQIDNDDPMPKVSVTPVTDQVREGETLAWRVSLSAVTDAVIRIRHRAVAPAAGNELSSTDVDPQWLLATSGAEATPSRPLSQIVDRSITIAPGQSQITMSVPTIVDDLAEPEEHLQFRLQPFSSNLPGDPQPPALTLTGTVLDAGTRP